MEVTRSNFQEVLEELESVLENATFLAIDGEFTGLNSGPDAKPFDTPSQYYAKLRSGSMDFLMVQFGLAVFTHNTQTNKYSERSYNFYVFPQPMNRAAPDCRFMCQASSIAFLAGQGFDFNKLFNYGIPYLTTNEEEKLNKKMEEKQKMREGGLELIPISDEDKPQIEEICTKIDEFLASDAEELAIDRCNAFIRRIIHQEASMRWPTKARLEAKCEGSSQMLMVYKMGTKEEEKQREIERLEREKLEIQNAVGLTALLRMIADSGKLIVGHNMLLDLCHMIHQFIGPLPESYREFKSLIHGLFPRLLDTKVICQSPAFKDKIPSSILDAILDTVSKPPFCKPDIESIEGRSYAGLTKKYHEAGYDAYITGLCFIIISNYLGSLQQPKCSTVLPSSPLLNPYLNKLLIARLKDFPYINLDGNDLKPNRDHVFHVTFPKEWKLSDLSQLFNAFGGVYVSWLSDTTAYVSLNRRDQATSLIKNLMKDERMTNCKIQTYAEHQNSLDADQGSQMDRKRKQSFETAGTKWDATRDGSHSTADNGWETASGNKDKVLSTRVSQPSESMKSVTPCSSPKQIGMLAKNVRNRTVWRHAQNTCSARFCDEQRESTDVDKNTVSNEKLEVGNSNTGNLMELINDKPSSTMETSRYTIFHRRLDSRLNREYKEEEEVEEEEEEPETEGQERINEGYRVKPHKKRADISKVAKQTDERPDKLFEEELSSSRSSPINKSSRLACTRTKHQENLNQAAKNHLRTPESTPTTSPKARSSSKINSKAKSVILGIAEKSSTSEPSKSNFSPKNGTMPTRDEQTVRKRLEANSTDNDSSADKVELKRPTLKLLRTAKKKSEAIFTISLLIRIVQVAGVMLVMFYLTLVS